MAQDNNLPYTLQDDADVINRRVESKENVRLADGRGDPRRMLSNIFSGFNHRNTPAAFSKNTDRTGFTFFTRPDFNYDAINVNRSRYLQDALRTGYSSYVVACMCMLDPQCPLISDRMFTDGVGFAESHVPFHEYGLTGGKINDLVGFDNRCAFIPMFSNLLLSLTGFPDTSLDVKVSEEGIMGEQRSYIDSTRNTNRSQTISGTFRNIAGDPITTMFNLYCDYMSRVKDSTFNPRWDNMLQRRVDHEMRVYRFVTDVTGRYVTKMGIANAVKPLNDSMGAFMNVNNNNNEVSTDIDQININFQVDVFQYNDPIIKQEFNEVVAIFNPDMWPRSTRSNVFTPKGSGLVQIKGYNKIHSNYYGYPRIDPNTNELQWWGYSDELNQLAKRVNNV